MRTKLSLTALAVLAGLLLPSGPAQAWGRIGIAIGIPIAPYPYYRPYYYGYNGVVYVQPAPVVVQPAPVYVTPPPGAVQPAPAPAYNPAPAAPPALAPAPMPLSAPTPKPGS
jgi:hypothetical protein